jgi:hypothetical protein
MESFTDMKLVQPISRLLQCQVPPARQNTISCSFEDGDSEIQLPLHEDNLATRRRGKWAGSIAPIAWRKCKYQYLRLVIVR